MAEQRRRYCHVGTGDRAGIYLDGIAGKYADVAELVGMCDANAGRMAMRNRRRAEAKLPEVPTYAPDQFDRMVAECRPDAVIVTTVDAFHHKYIIRAMELGCEAVTEKPMTTNETNCRAILDAIERTGQRMRVTFNYRYSPPRSQVKQLLMDGVVGEVLSVDFTWLLNTHHGADYFRRWHRQRENSGSLLVHKASHHFDMVNWWLGAAPTEVAAMGSLRFYTPQMADELGLQGRGERCLGCPVSGKCRFFLDLTKHKMHRLQYLECEQYDGYFRDRCVFGEKINIWDTMAATIRYDNGALMSYCLMAYAPWEGYRIAFTGTKGRLEHTCIESTYVSGDGTVPGELQQGTTTTLTPMWEKPRSLDIWTGAGGHGGGDEPLLDSVFRDNLPPDPLQRVAGEWDGAFSILTGIAAYRSIDSGKMVKIADLLGPWAGRLRRVHDSQVV